MQVSVPELVDDAAFYRQGQDPGAQAKRAGHALCKAFGHGGNQVAVAEHIAQGHVVRHREADAPFQALAFQRFIHPAMPRACCNHPHVAAADVQATLLELTAKSIADALLSAQPQTREVLVCGGGVRNAALMARLAAYLPQAIVESTAMHGLEPDYVEAMGFAWLAREALAGRPGNLPAVTGASGRRILGTVFPA